jgi:hypothetical protein
MIPLTAQEVYYGSDGGTTVERFLYRREPSFCHHAPVKPSFKADLLSSVADSDEESEDYPAK